MYKLACLMAASALAFTAMFHVGAGAQEAPRQNESKGVGAGRIGGGRIIAVAPVSSQRGGIRIEFSKVASVDQPGTGGAAVSNAPVANDQKLAKVEVLGASDAVKPVVAPAVEQKQAVDGKAQEGPGVAAKVDVQPTGDIKSEKPLEAASSAQEAATGGKVEEKPIDSVNAIRPKQEVVNVPAADKAIVAIQPEREHRQRYIGGAYSYRRGSFSYDDEPTGADLDCH
jgi:hypothetical protein